MCCKWASEGLPKSHSVERCIKKLNLSGQLYPECSNGDGWRDLVDISEILNVSCACGTLIQ